MSYLPKQTFAWSRVQNRCTYDSTSETYSQVYVPINNKTIPLAQATFQEKQYYKGNILKYKNNSSRLTKKQQYAQISKGLWCNRTKTFATQSQTYSNPNTTGLKRINYTDVPVNNTIIGFPNNTSGPYQYGIANTFDCSSNVLQVGGSLLCNAYVNHCTGNIIQTVNNTQCYPTYCSDVPGPVMNLCWNPKMATFFPKNRYVMTNSNNKWPTGFKEFQSAAYPEPPIITSSSYNSPIVVLNWTEVSNKCIPTSSYNIYQNGNIVSNVPYTDNSISITLDTTSANSGSVYTFYITALSNTIESTYSNSITINT